MGLFKGSKENKKSAKDYNDSGKEKVKIQDFEGAIQDFDEAIEIDPNFAEVYNNRGIVRLRSGDIDGGMSDLRKASDLGLKEADETLEKIKDEPGSKNVWVSEQEINEIIGESQKIENEATDLYNKGVTEAMEGNLNGAIVYYSKSIELNPNFADAFYNRGNAYYQIDLLKKALEDFDSCIRLRKNFAAAYYNRGMVKYYLGDKMGAINDLSSAAELGDTGAQQILKEIGL